MSCSASCGSSSARCASPCCFVTHDIAEAGYLADDLILMRDGRIVQRGSLKELVEAPADAFVADFVAAQRQLAEVLAEDEALAEPA